MLPRRSTLRPGLLRGSFEEHTLPALPVSSDQSIESVRRRSLFFLSFFLDLSSTESYRKRISLTIFTIDPSRFTRTCHLGSDGEPTCDCPAGYVGRRCEQCAIGYQGNPLIPGDMCVPVQQCDPDGSLTPNADPNTGKCRCKVSHLFRTHCFITLLRYLSYYILSLMRSIFASVRKT